MYTSTTLASRSIRRIPHVLEQLGLGYRLTLAVQEVVEQRELAGGQRHLLLVPPAPVLPGVEANVAMGQHGPLRRAAPPNEGPQPGQQDGIREGFGQEVVGAGVEGFGLIELALLGGQHQHGCPNALIAEGGGDGITVEPRAASGPG